MRTASRAYSEHWDLTPIITPPRTRLYRLQTLGAGTGWVESLTSYIARLAQAHCLPPCVLFNREIMPQFRRIAQRPSIQTGYRGGYWKASINGNNGSAELMVHTLEALTQAKHLRQSTLLSCGDSLAKRPLIRRKQVWCSACFQEWHEANAPLYLPLMWSLIDLNLCPTHRVRLTEHCPICKSTQISLASSMPVGVCQSCKTWLGTTDTCKDQTLPRPTPWELFVAAQIPSLLENLQEPTTSFSLFSKNVC
jgi:hypothetical protein